jgi:PAS domain S-box-containing protein
MYTSFSQKMSRFWSYLINPKTPYADIALQHKSRLLSGFIFILIVIFAGVAIVYSASSPDYQLPMYRFSFPILAYLLNRNKRYTWAAILTTSIFPMVVFTMVYSGAAANPLSSLHYVVVGMVLGSLFLETAGAILFTLINAIGIVLIPILVPDLNLSFTQLVSPLSVNLIAGAMAVIIRQNRDRIESDREKELRESETRFRAIFENSPLGIVVISPSAQILEANFAFFDMLGYTEEELLGMSMIELTHPDDVEATTRIVQMVLAEKSDIFNLQQRLVTMDGGFVWINFTGAIMRDDGQIAISIGLAEDVTERRLAEQALQESIEKFRGFMEQSTDGISLADENGVITEWSPGMEAITGIPAKEAVGKYTWDTQLQLVPQERRNDNDVALSKSSFEQIIQTGEINPDYRMMETTFENTRGEQKVMQIVTFPIKTGNGLMIGSIHRDISERKRAEEEIARSEQNLRKAQQVAHIGSWVWYTGTNEMEMSDELYKIIGRKKEDGVPPIDMEAKMVHPDDRELLTENITSCLQEKKPYSLDYRIYRQDDGEIRYLHVETEIVEIPGSEDIIIHGTVQDITERKQAEENLRKTARDLQDAQRIGNLGSWSNNAATREISWSDQVYRIFGYGHDTELSPTEIFDRHIHPDDKEGYREIIKSNFENPELMDFKDIPLRINSPSGETKYLTTSGEYFKGSNGEKIGARGTILDITERRITERKLQKYMAELARSNEELQQFAYIASHDLQEPLRKIKAFGDRLASKYAGSLDERGQDFVARMQDAAERGQSMVEALLTYSRITTHGQSFDLTDLNIVLKDVISDLEMRIEDSQGMVQVGELPIIAADPIQMRQLFQNLISNALKFHEPDQSPVVEVTCSTLSSSESSRDHVQISVKDQGIGFDEAFSDRIFQPFQRLHGRMEYEGSGIGLAVCRKIAERHGGTISAQGNPGKGAVFTVILPVKPTGSDQ